MEDQRNSRATIEVDEVDPVGCWLAARAFRVHVEHDRSLTGIPMRALLAGSNPQTGEA